MLLKLNVVGTTSQQWSISSLILALDNSSDVRLRLNDYLVIGTFPKLVLESTARRTANLREGLKTKKPPPRVVPSFVPKVPEVPELDDYSLPVFPEVMEQWKSRIPQLKCCRSGTGQDFQDWSYLMPFPAGSRHRSWSKGLCHLVFLNKTGWTLYVTLWHTEQTSALEEPDACLWKAGTSKASSMLATGE